MHRRFESSLNFESHIPSELDFLVTIKTTANIAPARKRSRRARTNRRHLLQWRRRRNFMLTESPSSTSSTSSPAAGLLRFLTILGNLVSAMQRNSLCQCSGGFYKYQEAIGYPRVWPRAILCNTNSQITSGSLSSGIYIKTGSGRNCQSNGLKSRVRSPMRTYNCA